MIILNSNNGISAAAGGGGGEGGGGAKARSDDDTITSPTHIMLQYTAGGKEEKILGMGTQFTYLNLKGYVVPVWVSEQGVSD